MVDYLLPYVLGMAGGVSFLLMVYGFVTVATAAGEAKIIAGGWETVKTAVEGLGVAIMAIFLMRFILLGVLKIPGIM